MNIDATPQLEKLLSSLGLEQRKTTTDYLLPAVGIFAAGMIAGGVLGLLFAPKAGRELREDLNRKAQGLQERFTGNGTSASTNDDA